MTKKPLALSLLLVMGGFSHGVLAQGVEQRLGQLERLVNSQGLLEILQRQERQELEIQQLRGRIEEQEHAIENLRARQRELYLDTDRRLSRIEREGVASQDSSLAAPTPATDTPLLGAAPASVDVVDEAQLQKEREAYQQAFDLLRELRYEPATTAFRDFLKQYPNGRYAHIAQYWLGEAGYAQRNFEQAIADYQILIEKFPNSPKRAEAMLKIGYSWNELKQANKSKAMLQRLLQEFPNSTEASQAQRMLSQM